MYYDSISPKYFIFYIQFNTSIINITSSSPKECPLASTLLELSTVVPNVFKYHKICQNNSNNLCFFDSYYLCICQRDHYRAECFLHNIENDHCTKCISRGKCIHGNLNLENDFLCLCPKCYYGQLCEFNREAFGFTFESLLIDCSEKIKIIYLIFVFLVFFLGLFNNFCSFITFKQSTPRKFGTGNYLFLITCFNQISLCILLIKFIQIIFQITNISSCRIISYFLSIFTRTNYWLTSWVTIDRFLIILFPTSIKLKKAFVAILIILITCLCLCIMHIHELIYYTNIKHLSTNSFICVTNFNNNFIGIYNRISTLIHYIIPFTIQIIGITLLIIFAARSRKKSNKKKLTFFQVLIKQFYIQKELYITPMIIILSALPQTILVFSLSCTELNIYYRHMLIIAYIFSYIPQVLGFILYVLPSTNYKNEFTKTFIGERLHKWIFSKNKKT